MPDREKVIGTLEEIKTQTAEIGLDSAVIAHKFIDKIIALLKEQEPKLVRIDEDSVHCPSCGNELFTYPRQKFCDECGQELMWNE